MEVDEEPSRSKCNGRGEGFDLEEEEENKRDMVAG
jgi:hypothetical protein